MRLHRGLTGIFTQAGEQMHFYVQSKIWLPTSLSHLQRKTLHRNPLQRLKKPRNSTHCVISTSYMSVDRKSFLSMQRHPPCLCPQCPSVDLPHCCDDTAVSLGLRPHEHCGLQSDWLVHSILCLLIG